MPVETKSPTTTTTITSGWNYPTRAYASDNLRTYSSTNGAQQEYDGYGFNLPDNANVSKVEVGVEWYTTNPSNEDLSIRVFKGGVWYGYSLPDQTSEALYWKDVTGTGWTPAQVNGIKTRISLYVGTGGGCYPDNFCLVVANNKKVIGYEGRDLLKFTEWLFLRPSQIIKSIKEGIKLYALVWNEERRIFCVKEVDSVDIHPGNWELYDFWSGEIDIEYKHQGRNVRLRWKSHVELTKNHQIFYSFDGKYFDRDTAGNIYRFFKAGRKIYVNHVWYNYRLKAFPVTKVRVRRFKGNCYYVRVKDENPNIFTIGKTLEENEYKILNDLKEKKIPVGKFPPFLVIAVKTTTYVDWIPVRVTYAIPTAAFPRHILMMGIG